MHRYTTLNRILASILIVTVAYTYLAADSLAAMAQTGAEAITGDAAAEAASRDTRPRLDSRIGNSVDAATGAFIQDKQILNVQGGLSLPFLISYNSLLSRIRGRMGFGWSHNYEAYIDGNPQGAVTVHWNSFKKNSFQFDGQKYQPLDEAILYDRLVRGSGGGWTLTGLDGSVYEFGPNGLLLRKGNKVNQYVNLTYGRGGWLSQVQEMVSDKKIQLHYRDDGLLESIQDDLDRVAAFIYDGDQRLTVIHNPARLGETQGDAFVPENIPDNDPAGLTHIVAVTRTKPIGLVQLSLANISHSRLSDLTVTLTSPQGTRAVLYNREPGGPSLVLDGKILDSFEGENPQGAWRVNIEDSAIGATGQLNGWQMRFTDVTDSVRYNYDTSNISINDPGPSAVPDPGNLTGFRSQVGQKLNFLVTGSSSGSIYGTDLYTDDSPLAVAAVHAGILLVGETGIVTVTILPGQNGGYAGSTRNGVTSHPWSSSWGGSYAVEAYFPHDITAGESSRIIEEDGPEGEKLFTNEYDSDGRVIVQDDGVSTNKTAAFKYDGLPDGGVRTTYWNRLGDPIVMEHDAGFHLLSQTDPLGNKSTWQYNSSGDRIRFTDALNRSTVFNYDSQGNLITVVDPAANVTTFSYEGDHNLRTVRDALGNETTFSYDGSNNVTRVQDALGNADNKGYSGSQMVSNILADGGGISYHYTSGEVTKVDHPVAGSAGVSYDAVGRALQLTDPDGNITKFEYNDRDQVTLETDPLGNTVQSEYDRRGRLLKQIDQNGNSTQFAYDNNDNLIQITDALGNVTRFVYDGEDRRIKTIDPRGDVSSRDYDAAGRVIRETDALGNSITHQYDTVGNEVATFDANGIQVKSKSYDVRDLPVVEADAFGQSTHMTYDMLGRMVSRKDPLQRESRFAYDALGRPIQVQDPLQRIAKQDFYQDDLVQDMDNPAGVATSFFYDKANRVTEIDDYYGKRVGFSYNGRDQVTQTTFHSGRTHYYTYDQAGRLTRASASGPGQSVGTLTYTYDSKGNLTVISKDGSARLVRTYDALDRLTSYTDGDGNRIGFSYDASGNLSSLTYPDGKTVTYAYDAANRMTSVQDWAGRITRYSYDRNGKLTGIAFPNGAKRKMDYDVAGQIVSREDFDAQGRQIVGYRLSYDSAGQITSEQADPPAAPYDPAPLTMTYDKADRLTSVNGSPVTIDADGNTLNGPLGVSFRDFAYDQNNNLVAAGDASYTYDEEDHLIGVDYGGNRARLVINPAPGLSQVLEKKDSNGNVTRFVYGVGLIYDENNGHTRTYHYDQRGSTAAFSSDSGTVSGRVAYGPFGEIVQRIGDTDSIFLYNGLFGVITDPQGLNYMRFRWYNPQIKRFVSQDAHYGNISDPGSLNRYTFAGNSPTNRLDPRGEFWNILAGAVVGAVVGVASVAITDLVTGHHSSWQEYAGAAVGGAVTGALLATCPACGLTGGIAFGALGGAASNLTKQGLSLATGAQRGFNVGDFALEVGLSAAFGGLGVGKGAGKAVSTAAKESAEKVASASAAGSIEVAAPKLTFRQAWKTGIQFARNNNLTAREAFKESVNEEAILDLSANTLQNCIQAGVGDHVICGSALARYGNSLPYPGSEQAYAAGATEVNHGKKATYGEFIHFSAWENAMVLAGRPLPNNPNRVMSTF